MAYVRTTSETKTDVNLLVEIDVNAYNEIEVDIKRSGLCVLNDGCGLSGNRSNECGNNTGFRSVVKRSLTLEKEVSRLKWREEYLTVCEDGNIYNAQNCRTASVSCMKNEASKQCLNDINNKQKCFRENSESPQKSKDYKGMYLVASSNMSHAQETQEAAFYMETQGNNDRTTCQQRFEENDPLPDELYKDKIDASYALRSQPEEVTMRTYKKKQPKGISDDMQNLHSVSYPQNQMKYTNGVNVENKLNDVTAKSVIIEEIGKKLIQFLGSAAGQKLMMEYSNGKQKSGNSLSSGNLLDSVFSLDMERIKMIVDEICNALQTQSSVTLDADSSKLQQNPQERLTTNKFFPKECFLTERSKLPANNTDEQQSRKKECSGVVSNKSERKIHRLNLKQSNRLHRNRYNIENYKRKGNTEGFHKQGISVNSNEARDGLNSPVSPEKMESGIKSIFLTVKETFNALLKNKLFESCTEKNRSSTQNKVEHQSVRAEGRLHSSGIPQRGEHSNTAAKYKNGTTSIEKGSHLSPRKLIKISKHTQAATHTKTLQNLENLACEYGIAKQRKERQMPYSITPPKSDKTKKWRKDDFQKLLFELLEKLCSKIKKKDLQRLSVLLDILMKLQDKNIPSDVETGNITKMVACYNIKQHTKDSTRECSTRQLHTITSKKESVADGTIENKHYGVCKTFYKETNSVSAKNYKKCIQTNLAHNSEILSEKNSIKKQVHTKFVANTSRFRTLQTNIQSKTDTLPVSNMCSDNIHLEEDLKTSLNNHVTNKINNDCIDCTQLVENCGTETMVESENQNDSGSRKLLPHCRVIDQRQNTLEDHNLATKEGKTIDNFLSLMRTSGENQSYYHFSPSVLSWQRMDGKIKCPIHQRENSCEYSHGPAANSDKINKSVTIMGLSEAYEMYNMTPSDVHLQRTNSKSKHSEKQICTHVHKIANVSSSLYKHAALTHDSSDVSVNKINGVGVKFNMPFSGEVIFPKTTECYKHSLKTGKTVKFYIPFRINRNNCMQLTVLESENKESRHVFENEKEKSVTDEEEINLMKEECTDDKKCVPNSCFLTSDECFTLQKALLHSVLLEHPQSNEQKLTVCQSIDYEESRCDKVESNGVLHETSSILLIESTAGKQAPHTNNCYSFQYIHKPTSPWKLEEQVGSFMFGAYTKRQFPVKSSFCIEDDLDTFEDHNPDLTQRNLESPCGIKTCDIKIIRESRELDQEIPNSRKTITEQLPTYFVFSAHNINTSKEKMQSHITRKTRKRNRNINDPQSSRLNEQTVDNYASYYQRPSICLEPTICSYDPGSQAAVEYPDDKNNNTQNKRAKRNKVLHYHDFCTSDSSSKLEKRKPIYSSVDFKNGINVNIVPVEPTTNTASQNPIKSIDQDSDINLNICPSDTENKLDTGGKCIEKNDVLNHTSRNLPHKLDEGKLFSSSVELNDDTSVYKIPFESITNTPMQQSVESLASDRKLDVSSSDSNQVQNIDHKETDHKKIDHKETERNDGLSHNDFQTSHFTSKLEEKKSNPLSVRFMNDQRERVYPLETSSDTSEEHFKVRHMESDYFPAKKSEKKHNIFSSDNEESSSNNDDPGLPKKNGYFGEESSNKRNIKSFERVKILSQIDANDMVKQAAPEEAANPNNVPSHLVSENSERDQHCSVSLNPDNITVCKDLPSTSVYNKKTVVPKDSLIMIKNRDVKGHSSDSVSMHSRKQSKVSRIFQKIFPKNNNGESILDPLGANADFQSFSTSNQFENAEQQNTNIKETEDKAPRPSGSEYDRWRLSQTKRLLKTHHALIKEAHDLGRTVSETGESDASISEEKTSKIKIGQSTWNACTAADFLLHFRRGFRDDQMTLNNKVCFVERMDLLGSDQENNHEMIDLMITCHPLDFLVKLGYSAEEAALISQDEEIKCRLYAAIREARIWANAITKPQAALLYLLAHKAKPKIMRYYLCLVESVINRRITNAVKLNELIDFLECLEDGEIALKDVFEDMAESDAMEEKRKTEDLYMVFHHMAEEEAMNCGRYPLSAKQMFLLQTLVSKYHIALQDHLALLTRYIGRGLIKNTVQLEAALVYLPHVGRHSVNIKEFEEYCGIKSKKKIETRKDSSII